MGLKLITAPADEPISLAEAKLHLRQTQSDDDDLINRLIITARRLLEVDTGRQYITATYELTIDRFPGCSHGRGTYDGTTYRFDGIEIPRPPLQSITSIQYVDANGATQTLSSSVYVVDIACEPGMVRLAYGQFWPSIRYQPNAVKVTFKAGFGDSPKDVPEEAKSAICLQLAHLYENRETTISGTIIAEVPKAYETLVWSLKVPSIQ